MEVVTSTLMHAVREIISKMLGNPAATLILGAFLMIGLGAIGATGVIWFAHSYPTKADVQETVAQTLSVALKPLSDTLSETVCQAQWNAFQIVYTAAATEASSDSAALVAQQRYLDESDGKATDRDRQYRDDLAQSLGRARTREAQIWRNKPTCKPLIPYTTWTP